MNVLTAAEQALLRAVIDRIYPADTHPSASGFGADNYILPMLDGDAKAVREMIRYGLAELARGGFIGKRRYRPMQWDKQVSWRTYHPGGELWFGFESVRVLPGVEAKVFDVNERLGTISRAPLAA